MNIPFSAAVINVFNGEAVGLKIDASESQRDAVKAGKHEKFTISSFIIPSDACGDKTLAGEDYPIYTYFPNKPDGKLIYTNDNTFHFKDFEIKKIGL